MTTPVVVIGASGFGRECLDVLEAMIAAGSDIQVLGVVDDSISTENRERLAARGVPFLGTRAEWLESEAADAEYVVGIGNPIVRSGIVAELNAIGKRAFTAVHPSVTQGSVTVIGEGSVVCAGVTLSTNVQIGRHVHVNPHATIGHDAILEDFVSVNPAAVISGVVTVREKSLVGAGAIVLQNLQVGRSSIVGAGAVVTRTIPEDVVAVGVPARWMAAELPEGALRLPQGSAR